MKKMAVGKDGMKSWAGKPTKGQPFKGAGKGFQGSGGPSKPMTKKC